MTMASDEFAQGFRLVYPDGYYLHGARFPSGRCVLDDEVGGLVAAAVDIDHLSFRRPGDRIEWDGPAPAASAATQEEDPDHDRRG